jgi:hypothetical protein
VPPTRPDCGRLAAELCDLAVIVVGLGVLGAQRAQVCRREVADGVARQLEPLLGGLRRAMPCG